MRTDFGWGGWLVRGRGTGECRYNTEYVLYLSVLFVSIQHCRAFVRKIDMEAAKKRLISEAEDDQQRRGRSVKKRMILSATWHDYCDIGIYKRRTVSEP